MSQVLGKACVHGRQSECFLSGEKPRCILALSLFLLAAVLGGGVYCGSLVEGGSLSVCPKAAMVPLPGPGPGWADASCPGPLGEGLAMQLVDRWGADTGQSMAPGSGPPLCAS